VVGEPHHPQGHLVVRGQAPGLLPELLQELGAHLPLAEHQQAHPLAGAGPGSAAPPRRGSSLHAVAEGGHHGGELLHVDQEGVVAVRGVEVLQARVRHVAGHLPLLLREVEHVAADGDHQRRLLHGAQHLLELAPPPRHVVGVHGARERVVGGGVEPVHQLLALVLEVALDGELLGGLGAPAVALLEALPAPVGAHGHHARRGEAGGGRFGGVVGPVPPAGIGDDGLPLGLGEPDGPGGVARRAGDGHDAVHHLREEERPLQHLHPAQRSPHHGADAAHAQGPDQRPLQPHHVPQRHRREAPQPGAARGRVDGGGPGGAVAAAEDVGADDEVAIRIEGLAGPEHPGPPAVHVGGAGEGMAHHHGVVAAGRQGAPGAERHLDRGEPCAALEDHPLRELGPSRLGGEEGGPCRRQRVGWKVDDAHGRRRRECTVSAAAQSR
jgi:hypothetical protein